MSWVRRSTSRSGRPRHQAPSSPSKPNRVKEKAPARPAAFPAARPGREASTALFLPLVLLLLGALLAAAGCAPRAARPRTPPTVVIGDPPPVELLADPVPPDAFADLLAPTRLTFRIFGYALRPPLGWSEPEQRPSLALDLYYADPDTGATLAISRAPIDSPRYDAWLASQRGILDELGTRLREVRVLDSWVEVRRGHFLFRIDHLHQVAGAYYHSRKALIFAGTEVVRLDFNAPTQHAERFAPLFGALLDTFELTDPARARLLEPTPDYVAEFRSDDGRITLPVPRYFARDDTAAARSSLARWSLFRNVTLTLAQHDFASIGLEPYGHFQVGVLRDAGHTPTDVTTIDHPTHRAFRITFETKAGMKSLFYIVDGRDRYYQLILTTDPISFPFLAPLADHLAADLRVVVAG